MLSKVWLPVGVVGDGQPRQPGAIIIHDVAGAVSRSHDLQGVQQRPISGGDTAGEWAELEPPTPPMARVGNLPNLYSNSNMYESGN